MSDINAINKSKQMALKTLGYGKPVTMTTL